MCPLAKQTRLPFPRSSVITNNPFDLIHCDIWGPYSTPSLNQAHYFLTIVDDFSRSTWLYLIRYKSKTPLFMKSFVNMVKTQFNKSIRIIL